MDNQPESISLRDRFGALLRDNRLAIAVELLLVILLVARVRNASILLLLISWLSLWLRRSGWKNIGMSRPLNWRNTILAGICIGILYQLFSIGVLVPVLHRLTNTSLDLIDELIKPRTNSVIAIAIQKRTSKSSRIQVVQETIR